MIGIETKMNTIYNPPSQSSPPFIYRSTHFRSLFLRVHVFYFFLFNKMKSRGLYCLVTFLHHASKAVSWHSVQGHH